MEKFPAADRWARFLRWIIGRSRLVVVAWALAVAVAAPFAWQLSRVAQGGSEAIRGTEAHGVMTTLDRAFGRGFGNVVPVVLSHESLPAADPRFALNVAEVTEMLTQARDVRSVVHPWNSGMQELLGRDGRSVILLVQPDTVTLAETEAFTRPLRERLRTDALPAGFTARVTGMSSVYHDINHRSAIDLLHAEMVGVPLTLVVLFLAFRRALAAALALGIAAAAVTLASAALCLARDWLPASVLAQNVVTMIGLGAGTDYALFLLNHYRHARTAGIARDTAIVQAIGSGASAIVVAGLAVAGGFAALFLVNARFVHSLALGGIVVIAVAVTAALTLLPALLHLLGDRGVVKTTSSRFARWRESAWIRWAEFVMRRPWRFLGIALLGSAACAWPVLHVRAWSIGPRDLPPDTEARAGFDELATHFHGGWMGPIAISIEGADAQALWRPVAQHAVLAIADELARDPRIAHVLGFPALLRAIGPFREHFADRDALPEPFKLPAQTAVSADGRTAVILAIPRDSPSDRVAMELVDELRRRAWPQAAAGGLRLGFGGGSALIRDFDHEMFTSAARVMAAVIALTFVLLLVHFRSVAVPLKAIAANLLSVFAAYGFLVLVFQSGWGTSLLGIEPPGGLNSFVVLMLFTILFGLSMDYEIFLLSAVRDEYRVRRDNTAAVAAGLASTASIITSAAAIMVCLFGSFGFFGLTPSRQFGLGLAFAVAFDATVVRLLIVPATMRLLGAWNWWLPTVRAAKPVPSQLEAATR